MNELNNCGERSCLQNLVDPYGNLQAVPDHGAWMGNRGILHDDQKQIVRPWEYYGWVTCRLDYAKNIRQGATGRDKLFTPATIQSCSFWMRPQPLLPGIAPVPCAATDAIKSSRPHGSLQTVSLSMLMIRPSMRSTRCSRASAF